MNFKIQVSVPCDAQSFVLRKLNVNINIKPRINCYPIPWKAKFSKVNRNPKYPNPESISSKISVSRETLSPARKADEKK